MKIGDVVKSRRTGQKYRVVEVNKKHKCAYVCVPVNPERYTFFDNEVTAATDKSWEGCTIQNIKKLDENTPEGCIIDSDTILADLLESWEGCTIQNIKKLDENTPEGCIIDSDTILADLLEKCNYQETGLAHEIFDIYKNSTDKEAVKKLFHVFTDVEFDSYLGTCMKKITRRKNTRISYLYRDAANYKKHNEVIIPGTFTEEQIHTIIDCLQGGEHFIPSEVNLPEIRFGDRTEADHPWFELSKDGFEETEAKANCYISPEDLVKLFLERKKAWQDEFYVPADWM
mgnify:CR=1 FL=1